MNITIQTILHESQAYDTVGNWRFDQNGNLLIEVSAMGDWRYELLVALHELIEVGLCKHRGISQESVDAFDIQYESERASGLHTLEDEPGDDPAAPYKKEHFFATNLERLMAAELGVDWDQYGRKIVEL